MGSATELAAGGHALDVVAAYGEGAAGLTAVFAERDADDGGLAEGTSAVAWCARAVRRRRP
ncbi:hypothetical protein ACFYY3_02115 [Streptomyces sp. NPDC001812]|uniref:Uncharacterized protein n=1 Tax=Streptomyces cathayae TaxID=3031124 RepID=A0ABY8K564_9ACTN|nr:hypothetical protein [Streptomyces sp. HUAS 5]WGD43414.1 hypothetical protein PYS65_26635 [Streptomyces sp. HUAS 5]